MAKLTLSVNDEVITRAKLYSKQQGVSISEMVETYLATVSAQPPQKQKDAPPILRSLRGSLKKADVAAYKKHLTAKYR